ncbi:sulfite exporter TauE/SafE family protein [Adhaeribacter soli]|uniref:Probable membrane transporter protein n=1 Tax=Adhaeribacter soli TaxID=2607655 RepID=A0A5N1J7K8_9BACT|nr:sulfite exporter TauE/SafE family protein [Adhaeribacter soli]KAA9345952.1 sulfite exporter TauE/SafE family protein [Adhaeribacter soli]
MQHPELLLFFFTIALVYASVGFGGGSSYLAVLALYALPFQEMRLIALCCNIIVVTGGTFFFIRHRQINWKKILPLTLTSVPMAFLGASLKMSKETFYLLLGFSLLAAAILLWFRSKPENAIVQSPENKFHFLQNTVLGGAIGFLSGMVGIGGGIFLAPLLNLLHWDTSKKIAATASVFILVNSIAGITGQLLHLPPDLDPSLLGLFCLAVFVGGQIGSRLGTLKFNALVVRRLTALLVLVAGLEVLFKHLPWFK